MRIIQIVATIFILFGAFIIGGVFFIARHPWVDFSVLARYQQGNPSIVLDDQGKELFRFQVEKNEPIRLEQVPPHVIQAFLAAEDRNFYQHGGISWKGIIRSCLANIIRGRKAQGASTITQQLVKLLFFDLTKTYSRKIKEQFLSMVAEQQFSKDQILETYLNHINFGYGIYGIEAASRRFWSKHVEELSIEEGALLAGIIRSPNNYCPLANPELSVQRRNIVLHCMYVAGFISQETQDTLTKKPLFLSPTVDICPAPHLKEMISTWLEEQFGKSAVYTQGLVIKTNVNRSMQEQATAIFTNHIKAIRSQLNPAVDGALISIDTQTGAIKALVGGYNFQQSQYNRAIQAQRQLGSIFKPLLYATALEQGMQLSDIEVDEPISVTFGTQVWEPKNSNKKFSGPMSLAYGLIHSNNILAVKCILQTGTDELVNHMKACALSDRVQPYPSLALGCVDSTALHAAGYFNIFTNQGDYVEPYLIEWVKDPTGKRVWHHTPQIAHILAWPISSQIAKTLSIGLNQWRGQIDPSWLSCPAIGKTGTTNDARTCWFVGSTPAYTTAVYVGCDDNRPMGTDVFAVRTALPLWLLYNKRIHQPRTSFSFDPRLVPVTIDGKTGEPCEADDPQAISLLKEASPRPRRTTEVHWQAPLDVAYDNDEEPSQLSPEHYQLDDPSSPPPME